MDTKAILKKMRLGKVSVGPRNPPREDVRLIEMVEKLETTHHKIDSTNYNYVKLRMIRQYPNQQDDVKPVFELDEFKERYEQMERDMVRVYKQFPEFPFYDLAKIKVGTYAVLKSRKDEEASAEYENDPPDFYEDASFVLKRVNIISIRKHKPASVKVKYIDYGTTASVHVNTLQSGILMLDKEFAVLPPRVCDIEMEGLSHYKDMRMRKYVRYDSEEYVFDGLLTAQFQASGKVVVWSERFPFEQFRYGINEYILGVMWSVIGRAVRLAPQGYHTRECYVVHVNHEGYVDIQVNSAMSRHFLEVFTSVTYEALQEHLGTVTEVKEGVIYMAPHSKSDGTYYRAIITKTPPEESFQAEGPTGEVYIEYIDYGDTAKVKMEDLVKAKDVNYLLSKFPKMRIRAHLDNIWDLKAEKYFATFHSADQMYTVHVVDAARNEPPEVIIKTEDAYGNAQIINKVIIENNMAAAILPLKDFKEHVDRGPKIMNLAYKANLYLRLEKGRRLQPNDEVNVDVIYNKAMPDGFFFIRPRSLRKKWLDFENELYSLEKKIYQGGNSNKTYEKTWIVDRDELFTGMSVLCYSTIVRHFARGVIVASLEMQDQNNGKEQDPKQFWEVYLPDYGVSEKFVLNALIQSEIKYASKLPFGCLAYHKELKTRDEIWSWWNTLPDYERPRHDIDYDYILSKGYDRNYYSKSNKVERKVRIQGVKFNYYYGEAIRVEWFE